MGSSCESIYFSVNILGETIVTAQSTENISEITPVPLGYILDDIVCTDQSDVSNSTLVSWDTPVSVVMKLWSGLETISFPI